MNMNRTKEKKLECQKRDCEENAKKQKIEVIANDKNSRRRTKDRQKQKRETDKMNENDSMNRREEA
jgi:hypothetical protein